MSRDTLALHGSKPAWNGERTSLSFRFTTTEEALTRRKPRRAVSSAGCADAALLPTGGQRGGVQARASTRPRDLRAWPPPGQSLFVVVNLKDKNSWSAPPVPSGFDPCSASVSRDIGGVTPERCGKCRGALESRRGVPGAMWTRQRIPARVFKLPEPAIPRQRSTQIVPEVLGRRSERFLAALTIILVDNRVGRVNFGAQASLSLGFL